jgi:hypothetical protein
MQNTSLKLLSIYARHTDLNPIYYIHAEYSIFNTVICIVLLIKPVICCIAYTCIDAIWTGGKFAWACASKMSHAILWNTRNACLQKGAIV